MISLISKTWTVQGWSYKHIYPTGRWKLVTTIRDGIPDTNMYIESQSKILRIKSWIHEDTVSIVEHKEYIGDCNEKNK